MTTSLSAAEARRMTLGAQGFSRRHPESVSARHLHRVMERMGVLQIDSVNVFARSHYLPMFARLGAYDPALFDRTFLSRSTRYIEYVAHEAAFLPATDWPLWQFKMDAYREEWAAKPDSWMNGNGRTVEWIRDELRSRGALRPSDLRDDAPRSRAGWWDWDDVKVALEHLWRLGEVVVSGRQGFVRSYALAEQVIPDDVLSQQVARQDAIRELVRRAITSYGVATEADLADYYRIRDRPAIRHAIEALIDAGEITPVVVRGWQRGGRPVEAWMHVDAALPRSIPGAALLTPFDPVVWFRERALRVFELDYRIEIYTPAHKRRFGYYSLPVLVGDRVVARVDLKADRAASTLLVQSAWWEPQSRASDPDAIAGELVRAASWQGLERISVSGWGDASDALAAALHGGVVAVERHRHPNE
jgi:uncharacterized protein YcaQ